MNQLISDSRTGASTCKFPIYIYKCVLRNKPLNEPFLEIKVMKKLKSSNQLETYGNYFHKKGYSYNTLNCPEQLKK